MALTEMLVLLPGTTTTFSAMACPRTVPLTRMLILKYGTVAVYFVGFVKLTKAPSVMEVGEVSKIFKLPTLGEMAPKSSPSPPLIAISVKESVYIILRS